MLQNLQALQKKPHLFPELVRQLEKDLSCTLSSQNLQELFSDLQEIVKEGLTKNLNFAQQLYKIDVAEKELTNALQSEKAVEAVTELILTREAQKVLFRFQYHQK